MLKALELIGFKSFAEKTRFEFPQGITVVVGPNGSGKSNIVDAIKWVLGEQSVKSLRGKEMADVIFNGSSSRRPMNSAEITLTLDNTGGLFAIDSPQVHITRRVYRSGEGEYLINRQPSRLRDIRDLLAGTGLGSQAYSVIEQGKVDGMLQASSRDRRVIFEEAAGISRFKAKKIEALRRLERVEQNLLRLADIVDEVDNRLRSVRAQAGKARRYKEYSDRLQELRTQVGLVDWNRLSQRLTAYEEDLAALDGQRLAAVAEAEAVEARLLEADTQVGDINEAVRAREVQNAGNRERIAASESTIEHERSRGRDLEQEIARHRRQLASMNVRALDSRQQLEETARAVESADTHHCRIARALLEAEQAMTDLMGRLDAIRGAGQQRRAARMDQMRAVAALGNEISRLEGQVAAADAARQQNLRRTDELAGQLERLDAELAELGRRQNELSRQADALVARVEAADKRLEECRRQRDARQNDLAQLQQRYGRAAERAALLEELRERQEGVGAGVKEVLDQARAATDGPLRQVDGLVADLLHVSVEGAPLIEVALGEKAQHVVVTSGKELLALLESDAYRFSGRVGFLWLDGGPNAPEDATAVEPEVDLTGRSGVLARADHFVETEPRYAALAGRLLGRTWIVEKLSHALSLAKSVGRGLSFVTLAGELLSADGTLSVGPAHVSTGLISRRSELRALGEQLAELKERIGQAETLLEEAGQQTARGEEDLRALASKHREAVEALARHEHKLIAAGERQNQLTRHRAVLEAEMEAATKLHDTARTELSAAEARRHQSETALGKLEVGLAEMESQIEELDEQRLALTRQTTETKVESAKSEERLGNLRGQMRQAEEGRQERHRAIAEARSQLALCDQRAKQAQWNVLRRESEIAELYLRKESLASQIVELIDQREALRAERSEMTATAQKCRVRARKFEEKSHARQLEASDVRHERAAMADRLREDYGIELAELEHEPTTEEQQRQRAEFQQEIDGLRRKLGNLGNVNIEALEELDQLEDRHGTLAGQHKDLSSAKNSLERIIERINTDSRRLFTETLETVRGHFQTLFRDLFGGGRADIILDENVDILESGLEIVARPPGKEPRSISLLSGGEKTLTCVALLLAIFRSRPSPFCVLDEVDAALDEANIDRFTKVLRDFLAWTQFVIVTHSKKTMTCATTIYGVTMQESGVSKQVSVRFEDVSDDGHIRPTAQQAESPAEAADGEDEDGTQAA